MNEKVRSPRRCVRLPCNVEFESRRIEGLITNVSASGLHIRFSQRLALARGQRIEVKFALPDQQEHLHFGAEVKWSGADGFGVHLFSGASEEMTRLSRFVREFLPTLLIVDDDETALRALSVMARDEFKVLTCASAEDALRALESTEVAVLVADHFLPGMNGLELIGEVEQRWPGAHLVSLLLSGDDQALASARAATSPPFDHIEKLRIGETFVPALRRAIAAYVSRAEIARLRMEMDRLQGQVSRETAGLQRLDTVAPARMLGESAAFQGVLEQIDAVAGTQATVLLTGESGVGKELAARLIHSKSARADRLFLPVNCAAISESLLESELFGAVRGAFTGADRLRRGIFEEAHGGTLFIDEVSEASLTLQAKLLRVLERGEVRRVGESRPISVDVRLIAATHRDLESLVAEGKFRADLFYRLAVVSIALPALRERTGDVLLLARHFLSHYTAAYGKRLESFSPEVLRELEQRHWPGNVRELEHAIESAVALATKDTRVIDRLPTRRGVGHTPVPEYDDALEQTKRRLIMQALNASNGVVTRAARALKMNESRLAKLVKQLDLGTKSGKEQLNFRARKSSAARRQS